MTARYTNFDTVNALLVNSLQLPPLAHEQAAFEMQRPMLVDALLSCIGLYLPLFP